MLTRLVLCGTGLALIAAGFLAAPMTGFGRDDPRAIRARAEQHWAFHPVQRPSLPPVKDVPWIRTPIDAFVLARLEARGIQPAPPADRRTLLRRVYLDLIGLPPSPE